MLSRMVLALAVLALVLPVALAPKAQAATDAEIDAAIQDGLAWLAAEQAPDGCWYGPYGPAAPTGLATWKFAERATELVPPLDPFDPAYAYHSQVEGGLDCIFSMVQESGGLVWLPGYPTYETGIDMIAVAASRAPSRIVTVPGSTVDGWTYQQVLAGMLAWMEDGQNDAGCEIGGWGYVANDVGWSDQSNTGYATMGAGFATAPVLGFGLTLDPNVLTALETFINNVQDPVTGASHYHPCWLEGWFNVLKQGNLLYEMALVGRAVGDPTVQSAVGFIEANWGATCEPGWQEDYQATFTMTKGLQAFAGALDTLPLVGDWFDQTSTYLVDHQNPDGSWGPGCGEGGGDVVLTTSWALLSLEPTAFIPPNTPPEASCVESVNPSGKKVPPAGRTTLPGPKGGQNEDGFYQLIGEDAEDTTADVFVTNASGSAVFGPFASGSVVKITEAPGATPSSKPMGGPNSAVVAHIKLDSDASVFAVDSLGWVSPVVSCLVPPPPK